MFFTHSVVLNIWSKINHHTLLLTASYGSIIRFNGLMSWGLLNCLLFVDVTHEVVNCKDDWKFCLISNYSFSATETRSDHVSLSGMLRHHCHYLSRWQCNWHLKAARNHFVWQTTILRKRRLFKNQSQIGWERLFYCY